MSEHRDSAQRATLTDVAAAAGVAVSTASRALATPGRGNPATREKILRIADRLGYVRPSIDPSHDAPRAKMVGLLVSDVTNPFYFGIIRGTQQSLDVAGFSQILVHTEESAEKEESALEQLKGQLDGAVLAAPRLSDTRIAQLSEELPLVALNRAVQGVPSVFVDTPGGYDHAIEHLASLGHRRICYASGPTASWANNLRWRAVMSACDRLGIESVRVGPYQPYTISGAAAADAVVNTGATACVAFNDLIAIGMLKRLTERGLRVPEELSIVGCDDIFGADFCNPPLTTLTAPIEQAARLSISMLLDLLKRNRSGSQLTARQRVTALPTHLTVRASTGPARTSGLDS